MVWLLFGCSAIAALLALAGAPIGHAATNQLFMFAAFTAGFALFVRTVPPVLRKAARYTITDLHVICKTQTRKRTIQRAGISFVRINWHPRHSNVADIDLVRAVPTGALRRRLTLTLEGVENPDAVLAIILGENGSFSDTIDTDEQPTSPSIEQRLHHDEPLRWQARPVLSARSWLPLSLRRTANTALAILCWMFAARTAGTGYRLVQRMVAGGVPSTSYSLIFIGLSIGLSVILLVVLGGWLAHGGISRKALLDRSTRYFVTDRRVILQRGSQELHVPRAAIVDTVHNPGLYGGVDVYLLLDGPHSRALSAQGAFGPGEQVRGFRPMIQGISQQQEQSLRDVLFPDEAPSSLETSLSPSVVQSPELAPNPDETKNSHEDTKT